MRDWSQCYRRLDSFQIDSGEVEVWYSSELADPRWDEFLRGTPFGQFQQSSMWAEYKAIEGWHHHRIILTDAFGIAGGFQILWKKNRMGRVGYVSKGPVTHPESAGLARQMGLLLAGTAKELGLTALIAQLPDETSLDQDICVEAGFIRSNPMDVIEATCLVEIADGMEAVRSRMHPSIRKNVRKARRNMVSTRDGTEADLTCFFDLMAATCARQNTVPNPASVGALQKLWRIFSPAKSIRLVLAECEGRSPAGQLCLAFGNRVTLWKKGWDGTHPNWHTTELLEDATFEWSHANGYKICDFCSIERSTALRILSGKPADGDGSRSRDAFNLRFGGVPKILPSSQILIPNSIMRWGYRNIFARVEQYRSRGQSTKDGTPS